MTTVGWIVMAGSVGGVTALFAWCLARVLATRHSAEKPDAKQD